MVLVFDIDGCLANFTLAYGNLLISETGRDILPEGWRDQLEAGGDFPTVWDWEAAAGYTPEEATKVWKKISSSKTFWKGLAPYAETRMTLKRIDALSKDNEVIFLTHRSGNQVKRQTEMWLYDQGIKYPTVILSGDKAPMLNELKADFFIDDKLDTMNQVYMSFIETSGFYLLDRPYNQDGRVEGMRVATSVNEALTRFLELGEG